MGTFFNIGGSAHEFSLQNQNGDNVEPLSFSKIGRHVLLSFHPLAWTDVCELQMKALEIKKAVFENLETTTFGISVDSPQSKKKWAEAIGVKNTDFLSDFWPHGDVATRYGIFMPEKGISKRANFIVDPSGNIEWCKVYDLLEVPDIEEIISFLEEKKS